MTSETYLDLTFDRSAKNGKRPIRPKLLKLTDAAIPRRNRKKTKTKTKDRSLSSVRDRIYDDPAYTDDISHLANPLRPRSYERRSSNVETKTENFNSGGTQNATGGSLNKRSKYSKEFQQYTNKHGKTPDYSGNGIVGGNVAVEGVESFGHACSSSSDEHPHAELTTNNSITRRGRSLDRSVLEKNEKRRERASKQQQQRNASLGTGQQDIQHEKKQRKYQNTTSKSFAEDGSMSWNKSTQDADVASTSNAGGSKMHIGRRLLRGEIGIKSFNYYLLKEGLKSSKRLVGKQRNTTSPDRISVDKKQQSRSEENIYEEIFFKDASTSDEENQNEPNTVLGTIQQLDPQAIVMTAENTAKSQVGADNNVFPNCDLCIQNCTKDNCEYCFATQAKASNLLTGMIEPQQQNAKFANPSTVDIQNMSQPNSMRRHVAVVDNNALATQSANTANNVQDQQLNDNGNNNLPAAHILEFQSYNPNNPGVYKIETTPVAITGEYNPIFQFQQSSTTSSTATTTPSDRQQSYVQVKAVVQPNRDNVGNGIALKAGPYYQGNIVPLLTAQTRQRMQRFPITQQQQQQQFMLSCNGSTPRIATNFSMNAKSSSSSDSLQQQHKFNTVARMDSSVPYSDPFYGGSSTGFVQMHPLIYASSRPIGGSQILIDPYEQMPHIYKSDSRASILSEYSLRSSDNSHRYGRYMHHRGGGRGESSAQGTTNAVNAKLIDAKNLYKPTAAPRTILQSSKVASSNMQYEKDQTDYVAQDRTATTATATGAIPKTTQAQTAQTHCSNSGTSQDSHDVKKDETPNYINEFDASQGRASHQSPKQEQEKVLKIDTETSQAQVSDKVEKAAARLSKGKNTPSSDIAVDKRECYLNVSTGDATTRNTDAAPAHVKRHHRNSSSKTSGTSSSRRRDTPAAPPPSPATYSDLQELKANLESMQDDTKSPKRAESVESTTTTTVAINKEAPQQTATTTDPKTEKSDNEKGVTYIKTLSLQGASVIDTEEDDVFYDARSEDSGGTPATQTQSMMAITLPKRLSSKMKGRNNDDESVLDQNLPNQQKYVEKSQAQQRNNSNIAIRNNDEKTKATQIQIQTQIQMATAPETETENASYAAVSSVGSVSQYKKSSKDIKQLKKDNTNIETTKSTTETTTATTPPTTTTISKHHDCVDCSQQIATDESKLVATTTATKTKTPTMALNPVEANANVVITTKQLTTKEAAATNKIKDIALSMSKARKHGERRSKSTATRQQQQQATTTNSRHGTNAAMLTISCDTCCQIEYIEREMKRQQQTKIASNNRGWRLKAESETPTIQATSSKEQTSKIKPVVEVITKTPTTCAIATLATTTTTTAATTIKTSKVNGVNRNKVTNNNMNTLDTLKNDAATINAVDNTLTTAVTTIATTTTTATRTTQALSLIDATEKAVETAAKAETESARSVAVERKAVAPKLFSPTTAATTTTTTTTTATTTILKTTTTVEAAATMTTPTTTRTTTATSFAVSCNSDIAGVATLSHSVVDPSSILSSAASETKQDQKLNIKHCQSLQRQDYSCLDSSEAQSDDSHLTQDSVTRESQNDELSSSTLDKIDVSGLPLPALPPKKRRTRQRPSPAKHHNNRTRDDIELSGDTEVTAKSGSPTASSVINTVDAQEDKKLSAFQQYVAKRRESLEASSRSFNEKLEALRKMHYHTGAGGNSGGGSTTAEASHPSGSNHIPTYLFGENYCGGTKRHSNAPLVREEIFLNKSGWVQVNKRTQNENRSSYRHFPRSNGSAIDNADMRHAIRVIQIDDHRRSDMARKALLQHQHSMMTDASGGYAIPKFVVSKVEELIKRNEARLGTTGDNLPLRDPTLRPGYRIVDPQLASILNERPGFLPVRNPGDADSPPPITPILSPPPAFQDNSKGKRIDRRKASAVHRQAWPQPSATASPTSLHVGTSNNPNINGGKGMVFSRSFEYDTRRPKPADSYVETFSRSFDGNLSERPTTALQRDRSPNFSSLTGNSPNYLSKKDSGGGSSGSLRSRDSSPKYQARTTAYLNTSVKEAPPAYNFANSAARHSPRTRRERSFERSKNQIASAPRSRKSQFNRMGSAGFVGSEKQHPSSMSRFRSFDTTINQRLNSCDSGARSDLSNDELDNNDDITGSTEFLTVNYHQNLSPLKKQRQRSLTPERNESRSSSSSTRKQRSLTPESRSLTPEDRRKKSAQVTLISSRQNSGTRSNTLERKQCLEDKTPCISRSSSSSSYSGSRDHDLPGSTKSSLAPLAGAVSVPHRRSLGRIVKQTEEHRIRRSRSLQLSERSPNRTHKSFACAGTQQHPSIQPIYQQGSSINNAQKNNFPLAMPSSSGKLVDKCGSDAGSRVRNNDMDKSHSFDFDYNYYNSATASKTHINQVAPLRLDFDKSRSFDDDYRESFNFNNSIRTGAANHSLRYLQTAYRKSSPSGARSPQHTGSPCNSFRMQRRTTSPQNYGTRLCDHELIYDKLRKSMARSPIMDFCQGSDIGDYEIPQHLSRNRETINSGGNSELNFMNNDTFIYETPTTTSTSASALKQQRSLGHSQLSNEQTFATSSEAYRQVAHHHGQQMQHQTQRESRSGSRGSQQNIQRPITIDKKSVKICDSVYETSKFPLKSKTLQHKPINNDEQHSVNSLASTSKVNVKQTLELRNSLQRNKSPWKLLCSGAVPSTQLHATEFTSLPSSTQNRNYISQTEIKLTPKTTISIQNDAPNFLAEVKVTTFKEKTSLSDENENEFPKKIFFKSNSLPELAAENEENCEWRSDLTKMKLILPSLMETYELVKFWDFDNPTTTIDEEQCQAWIGRRRSSQRKQKTRAVSSPSLDEESFDKVKDRPASKSKSQYSCAKSPNSYPNVNVLQKLKQSFASLGKCSHGSEMTSFSKESFGTSSKSASLPKVSMEAADSAVLSGNSVKCRNRYETHSCSSSKEYNRVKDNRNKKTHSADYGKQIEMDMNKRRNHLTMTSNENVSACNCTQGFFKRKIEGDMNSFSVQQSLSAECAPQVRSLRRSHSSKANHTSRKTPDSLQLKPSKRDINSEREPPESLPVRSISQPHSLDFFGINRPDSECDSHSIASNDEAADYFPMLAEVIHNFTAVGPHELGLERGTLIEILSKEVGPWWLGRIKKYKVNLVHEILDPELGWFPKDFVRVISFPETDAFFLNHFLSISTQKPNFKSETLVSTKHNSAPNIENFDRSNITTIIIDSPPLSPKDQPTATTLTSTALDSSSILRHSAVKELLATEVNYVKLLTSICEGYLPAMTKRIDIFPPNSIRLIFSNIAAIYSFQRIFLQQLRKGIEQDQIAKIFLKMHKGFLCYSNYCNSYPRALIELELYERVKDARIILENCRETENLSEFPLAAHLLSPVQRICRYPLHLSEILKMTSKKSDDLLSDQEIKDKLEKLERLEPSEVDIPDTRKIVEMALEAMKGITEAVNEGKRHSETISRHQASFQNFKGPPLHFHSVRFFLQIDATRQKQNLWNSSYTLFLFDNQLIYCKRDIIKRSQFIYKGRIFIDHCRVVNVRDGKMFGQTIKNALRIYCDSRDKWYDFCFRSANRKQKFLHTLALERQFGGKVLYVSEMTGLDYALRERSGTGNAEFSDQSDYEFPETEYGNGNNNGCSNTFGSIEYVHEFKGSGNNSLPESPSRLSITGGNVTLPKKSKSRDSIGFQDEIQTGSLGRRRLGNWFRRPKSSNSTPNLSPIHKPLIPMPLVTQTKELQLGVIHRLGNAKTSQE